MHFRQFLGNSSWQSVSCMSSTQFVSSFIMGREFVDVDGIH